MKLAGNDETQVELAVHNIGGIDETVVALSPDVTALTGRNATNRTSLLQAIMAALGSDQSSLKGDADEGSVELTVGDTTFTRTLTRQNGSVAMSGDPYLDDPELADLFAFLLESNEARRAVARNDDLRDLIMRPVDTNAIQDEIEQLETEKRQLDDELSELDSLKQQLPDLEQQRTQLESKIEDKQAELAEKEAELDDANSDVSEKKSKQAELNEKLDDLSDTRSELESIRFKIETETESIQAVENDLNSLSVEDDDLPEAPDDKVATLEEQIQRQRTRKQQVNATISELQSIIEFNENMLDEERPELQDMLQEEEEDNMAASSDGSITDQLVDDTETEVCWTCGSTVQKQTIEQTVTQLRELRKEKLADRKSLDTEIEKLQDEKQSIEQVQREHEQSEQRRQELASELEEREARVGEYRETKSELTEEIETLEQEVEDLEQEEQSEVLDLHKEANQLEFEIERLESELEDVEDEISSIESQIDNQEEFEAQREEIQEELRELRTRIDQIEANAVEQFNAHMETVLDLLEYANLDRIWIERSEQDVREGRRKVTKSVFTLHVIRSTDSGTTYEDTIEHLSESEREVTGLVFALAGYLVHDVYEDIPFILLDSLEAIDSDRIAGLVEYFSEYADYLIAALLPEDAAALDDDYERVTEI